MLKKSQECTLTEGDQINLVVEEAVAGTGRSFEWSGNPCAYRVSFVETSAATAKARAHEEVAARALATEGGAAAAGSAAREIEPPELISVD